MIGAVLLNSPGDIAAQDRMPYDPYVALAQAVLDVARPGDMIVCLGAGSITSWAYALPDQLEHLAGGVR